MIWSGCLVHQGDTIGMAACRKTVIGGIKLSERGARARKGTVAGVVARVTIKRRRAGRIINI